MEDIEKPIEIVKHEEGSVCPFQAGPGRDGFPWLRFGEISPAVRCQEEIQRAARLWIIVERQVRLLHVLRMVESGR